MLAKMGRGPFTYIISLVCPVVIFFPSIHIVIHLVIHPSKFLITEEEDDGRGGGGRRRRNGRRR
jgi:hypothetical protein